MSLGRIGYWLFMMALLQIITPMTIVFREMHQSGYSDMAEWLAKQPLQRIMLFRTSVLSGVSLITLGCMLWGMF